ncbi:MAG: hypothetical protein JWM11_2119 [Planctomycetaceae bacterium]|nr:hypothetical protein [Planctomycetaceae bacterium]
MITAVKSHSAIVTMELYAGNVRVPLAQLGPDFAIPVEAVELQPCEAEIVMTIDGVMTRMRVFLQDGMTADRRRVPLSKIPS